MLRRQFCVKPEHTVDTVPRWVAVEPSVPSTTKLGEDIHTGGNTGGGGAGGGLLTGMIVICPLPSLTPADITVPVPSENPLPPPPPL